MLAAWSTVMHVYVTHAFVMTRESASTSAPRSLPDHSVVNVHWEKNLQEEPPFKNFHDTLITVQSLRT